MWIVAKYKPREFNILNESFFKIIGEMPEFYSPKIKFEKCCSVQFCSDAMLQCCSMTLCQVALQSMGMGILGSPAKCQLNRT